MDIKQLHYFITVAEELHMGRAAARLHLSPPPVTRHIHALEEEIGVQLFVRTPFGVELTAAGVVLLKEARVIRSMLEQAEESTRRAGKGNTGTLDIGVFGSVILEIVPDILARFNNIHPDVNITLQTLPTELLIEAVLLRKVALAFEWMQPNLPELAVHLVARESLVVAMHRDNPLVAHKSIHIHDLAEEKIILGKVVPSNLSDKILSLFRTNGILPRLGLQADEAISATALIACGFGVGLMPESMRHLALPNLVFRPLLADGDSCCELYCFYRRDNKSAQLKALLDIVAEYKSIKENLQDDI